MKKNLIISLILAIVTAVVCLSSCSGIKKLEDMKITSANIAGISPDGMKAVKMDIQIGIDNPGAQISLSEISCDLKHFGKILGMVAVDPFTLHSKTEEIYNLKADVRLGDGLTLFDAGKLMNKTAADEIVVDLKATVTLKGGISKKLNYCNIPLKKLIETATK